ncbi:hypothetical protein GCM10018781_13880 [Kitasatospora indigofera]|uniref:Uncharacterized protein n=1 Tax=Kitasatospora indigofera TaxID=67307 RepID=A0A919KMA0_9ACTN|nr:hypothetical protein GCM10018781_13880 [Kitasatospora indigofera]
MATAAAPAARADTPGRRPANTSAGGCMPKGRTPPKGVRPSYGLLELPDQASPPAAPGSAEATSSSW